MLYISRILNAQEYGVADTETGIEYPRSWADLMSMIVVQGWEIKGVETIIGVGGMTIKSVSVWQNPADYSIRQTKMKTIFGIDVRTYKDEITMIIADPFVAKQDFVLKLSDFGSKLSYGIVIRWLNNLSHRDIILKLDDSIEFAEKMPCFSIPGFIWDLRDVTREDLTDMIYRDFINTGVIDKRYRRSYVVDTPERDNFWHCIASLDLSDIHTQDIKMALLNCRNSTGVAKKIDELYGESFSHIAMLEVETYKAGVDAMNQLISMVRRVKQKYNRMFKLEDYMYLRASFIGIFSFLKLTSNYIYINVMRFCNYIMYYDVTDYGKQLYVELCNNAVCFVELYCMQKGISL